MNNLLVSFFGSLFATFCAFLICIFLVIGVKFFFIFLKERFFPTKKPEKAEVKVKPKQKTIKKVYKPIKTIEIDPNEVDRIVVKR